MYREWDPGEHLVLMDGPLYQLPPSSLRDLCRKGPGEIPRGRGGRWLKADSVLQTQLDWGAHELTETGSTYKTRTGSNQRIPAQEGFLPQGPIPNQEIIGNWYLLGRGKSVFSNGVSLGISITPQGKLHAQRELANTKWIAWILWGGSFAFFCLFCFMF